MICNNEYYLYAKRLALGRIVFHPRLTSLRARYSPHCQSDMIVIGMGVVYLNMFEAKQYPTFWSGRGEKLSWEYFTRRKQVDGAWCCGKERPKKPSETGQGEPPDDLPTKDDKV